MPILDVEIVTRDGKVPADLATRLADAAGAVFDAEPGRVWVKLRGIPVSHYAENDTPAAALPRPVFVAVLLAQTPDASAWARTVAALTDTIARCCERPAEHVHVLRLPEARGRMAFGGRVVGDTNLK